MISSVGEYLNIIKSMNLDSSNSYYRGQSSSKYHVSSNLYRYFNPDEKVVLDIKNHHEFTDELFKQFLDQFPIYSDIHTLKDYSPNKLDLLVASQHYGLITRLIDFSKSPLIALYFATENIVNNNEKCSVIIITNTRKNLVQSCGTADFYKLIEKEKESLNDLYYFSLRHNGLKSSRYLDENGLKEYDLIRTKYLESPESFGVALVKINGDQSSYNFFETFNPFKIERDRIESFKLREALSSNCINFKRKISSVELANKNKYILSPLPNTARIRNQQGVLLFSNNINKPLYQESDFNITNTITSQNCLSKIDQEIGYYRIDINGEYVTEINKELVRYGISEEFIYPEINSFTKNLPNRVLAKMLQDTDFIDNLSIDDLNNLY